MLRSPNQSRQKGTIMAQVAQRGSAVWLDESQCSIDAFRDHLDRHTDPVIFPYAVEVAKHIPVYDGEALASTCQSGIDWHPVMAEWNWALSRGPGIIAIIRVRY